MNFKNGIQEGVSKNYSIDGKLESVEIYKNGELKERKKYYENGKLESIGNFSNGRETGEWKYYDKQGNLTKTENY